MSEKKPENPVKKSKHVIFQHVIRSDPFWAQTRPGGVTLRSLLQRIAPIKALLPGYR